MPKHKLIFYLYTKLQGWWSPVWSCISSIPYIPLNLGDLQITKVRRSSFLFTKAKATFSLFTGSCIEICKNGKCYSSLNTCVFQVLMKTADQLQLNESKHLVRTEVSSKTTLTCNPSFFFIHCLKLTSISFNKSI